MQTQKSSSVGECLPLIVGYLSYFRPTQLTSMQIPSGRGTNGGALLAYYRTPVVLFAEASFHLCCAGLSHLSTLTKLTSLNVAYTTAGDGALAAWTSLTNLRTLNLDSCPVSDRWGSLTPCHVPYTSYTTFYKVFPSKKQYLRKLLGGYGRNLFSFPVSCLTLIFFFST